MEPYRIIQEGSLEVGLEPKKSPASFSLPKILRNSVNAKKGTKRTARIAVIAIMPFSVPPATSAMLCPADFPWKRPTQICSTILKQPKTAAKATDLKRV